MGRYKKIFFDLDGTLCNSYRGIENGIKCALNKTGITTLSEQEIKKPIGIPLSESLGKYYLNNSEKIRTAIKYFREYYSDQGIYESELYSGIAELLECLSGFSKIYVVTAKPTIYAKKLLEHHNVRHFFTEIKGCQLEGGDFRKSKLMLEASGQGNAIIVDDKREDIEADKEIGIKTAGVLYGYGVNQEITDSNPDFIVKSVAELNHSLA